jgi:predicted PurR-regulated permease PerM
MNNANGYVVFRNTLIVLGTVGLAYLLVVTLDIWILLWIAILIASAVRPAVMQLRRVGLPQTVAVLLVYAMIAVIGVTLLVAVVPPIVNQFIEYIQNDNRLANRLIIAQNWTEGFLTDVTGSEVDLGIPPDEIREAVRDFVDQVRITAPTLIDDISSFLGNFALVIVMGVYWVTSRVRAETFLVSLLPLGQQPLAREILEEIDRRLGAYVRGIILISFSVGLLSFAVLSILRVPGAATLSLFYGTATAIPIIGGFIGVVSSTAIALLSSPQSAVTVLVVMIIMQQIENYIISPRVMSRNTDFDEILVLVFVAMGFTLNGVTGALIAIPVAGTVAIVLKHLVLERRKAEVTPIRVEGGVLLRDAPRDSDVQTASVWSPDQPR